MTDNTNPSTLGAVYDKVTGAAQSALGSLTGSTADQSAGDRKQAQADAKDDLSHAGANVAGHSVSATGVTKNDPNRSAGNWNQTVGAGKETLGNLIGAEGLKQEGIRQNQEGKQQEAQGQLSDLGKGVSDRVSGSLGGAVAGLTGDKAEQAKRQAQHDEGKTRQRGVEADLEKSAPQ
ncbi:hypothetical protein CAC42_5744 [Sphaceloma murrayae]|uniref:CsbD-like domain-containing protein n=1 Tax=Sphaceloma murrayae TaxID=2082308 RepID=A0A2K1QZ11_9PEZI|nr:hypothetical protein CAC42_5744 [Sphaceloma murrayae]